jgi:RNA polymerase sigma-70 factor (ECF subfamily)
VDYSKASSEELIRACVEGGDSGAWEEFVRRFHRLIATVALRTARHWGPVLPEVVDELVQETYLKLCERDARLLRSFVPRHEDALYGYLKVVTANLVHDHFRELHAQKRGAGIAAGTPSEQESPILEKAATGREVETAERQVLIHEIDAHLRSLVEGPHSKRDRRIFWLYYRVGLSAQAIAALPGIALTTKGVESTLLRLTRELRQRLATERTRSASGVSGEGIRAGESF